MEKNGKKGERFRAQVLLKSNAHRRRGRKQEGRKKTGWARLGEVGRANNESPFYYMYFFEKRFITGSYS